VEHKWQQAQAEDARMVADLEKRNNSDADWKAGVIRKRMIRRQSFAADRNVSITPQVCGCDAIVDQLVSVYWMCDECVTDCVASVELASA
jgi:hypothetical protein